MAHRNELGAIGATSRSARTSQRPGGPPLISAACFSPGGRTVERPGSFCATPSIKFASLLCASKRRCKKKFYSIDSQTLAATAPLLTARESYHIHPCSTAVRAVYLSTLVQGMSGLSLTSHAQTRCRSHLSARFQPSALNTWYPASSLNTIPAARPPPLLAIPASEPTSPTAAQHAPRRSVLLQPGRSIPSPSP